MIASALAFAFITAIASAAHGGDYLSKGKLVAFHVFISALLNPVLALAAGLFWAVFRRSAQAEAELDFLSGKASSLPIRRAYLPPFGIIMQKAMEWCQKHPLPDFGAETTRRQQELIGGFIIGLMVGLPLLVVAKIAGVFCA